MSRFGFILAKSFPSESDNSRNCVQKATRRQDCGASGRKDTQRVPIATHPRLPFKRETAIHVICQSGGRSAKFCDKLQDNGYLSVYDVDGGVDAWKASGMELVNGEKSMSMERQVRIAAGTMVIIGVAFGAAVAPAWYALSGFIGAGLVFAGVTDTCGMGMALAKMPWNQK